MTNLPTIHNELKGTVMTAKKVATKKKDTCGPQIDQLMTDVAELKQHLAEVANAVEITSKVWLTPDKGRPLGDAFDFRYDGANVVLYDYYARMKEGEHILSPPNTNELYRLVKQIKPELVVEVGTGVGCSTAFIAKAMNENDKGRVITIENEAVWSQFAKDHMPPELAGRIDFRLAPEDWAGAVEWAKANIIVVDGAFDLRAAADQLTIGTLIVIDGRLDEGYKWMRTITSIRWSQRVIPSRMSNNWNLAFPAQWLKDGRAAVNPDGSQPVQKYNGNGWPFTIGEVVKMG